MTAALLVEDDLAAAAPGALNSRGVMPAGMVAGTTMREASARMASCARSWSCSTATFTPSGKRRKASSRFWASSVNCTGIGPTWVISDVSPM